MLPATKYLKQGFADCIESKPDELDALNAIGKCHGLDDADILCDETTPEFFKKLAELASSDRPSKANELVNYIRGAFSGHAQTIMSEFNEDEGLSDADVVQYDNKQRAADINQEFSEVGRPYAGEWG